MPPKRVVVVGNGRMAQECSYILLRSSAATVPLLVAEQRADTAQLRLTRFCQQNGIPLLESNAGVNSDVVLTTITAQQPDFIFSIDNFQVFGKDLLRIAPSGSINFHNAPISRYRGVHAPSWAIFNDEKEHGITWHYMEPGVDAGAIAAEERFALTGAETALSLILDCIRVGTHVLERRLDSILAGHRTAAIGVSGAKMYRRVDVPDHGMLDLRSTASHIDRLLRATDFRPFENPLGYARLRCSRGDLIVNKSSHSARMSATSRGRSSSQIGASSWHARTACCRSPR